MNPLPELPALLTRIGNGEALALKELYQASSNALLGIILSVLKDRHEAEEVLQDVFLRIWKNSQNYHADRGSPMSWMITIARNASFDRYRQRSRRASSLEKATPDLQDSYSVSPDSAPDLLLNAERRAQIRKALGTLVPEQREAIEMAFLSGHTQSEVASHLKVPLGTVKARIRRGMLALKPLLMNHA